MITENKLDLDDLVDKMKDMADSLSVYTWPKNHPKIEDEIAFMKTIETSIDGYDIIIYFSRADYESRYHETLQVLNKNTNFIPFYVVAKLAKKFLGSHCLYLTELIRDNRKLYIWTVWTNKRGCPINVKFQRYSEDCEFEGFQYRYVNPKQMSFH